MGVGGGGEVGDGVVFDSLRLKYGFLTVKV